MGKLDSMESTERKMRRYRKPTTAMIRQQKCSLFVIAAALALYTMACNHRPVSPSFDYGTQSDSARYYFIKGWEEIMDYGRWTASEAAFRKAVELDPDCLLCKSLLGRITRDPAERQVLFDELESRKDQAGADERLLLDVNLLSLQAANQRDQGVPVSQEFTTHRRQVAEMNFGEFARKYPADNYFKAEYIELLHTNHGAQVALDSLRRLATTGQLKLGFFISYSATLELELGNVEKAMTLADQLEAQLRDPSFTSPLMLRANIYLVQDSLNRARELVDRVVAIDPNHLIALATRSEIAQRLGDRAKR